MDPVQVVRYIGDRREAVLAQVRSEVPRAAAAGFRARSARWDPRRARPTLIVEFRYEPPALLERRFVLEWPDVRDKQVLDCGEMALAGYVPEEVRWLRTAAPGFRELRLRYRFDPSLAGSPISPIAPRDDDPSSVWWVVRPDLRPVQIPAAGIEDRLRRASHDALGLLQVPRPPFLRRPD